MKKFTKLFLSCALVGAMAMSSMVAFADWEAPASYDINGGEITGTYDPTSGAVTITDFKGSDTVATDTQATFLVVKGDNTVTATQENVAGIDQEKNGAFTKTGIKDKPTVTEGMDAVTYSVYVGYYNASNAFVVKKGTFVVNDGASEPVLMGDITTFGKISELEPDEAVDLADARAIIQIAGGTLTVPTEKTEYVNKAADVATFGHLELKQGDGAIDLADARAIIRAAGGVDDHGLAGDTVE